MFEDQDGGMLDYYDLTTQRGKKGKKKVVKEAISTYCQMDTYAEYVVYHGLIKEVEKDA